MNIFSQGNAFKNVVCEISEFCHGLNVFINNRSFFNEWANIDTLCGHDGVLDDMVLLYCAAWFQMYISIV